MRIKEELNSLKQQDIYSLMLFAMFKLRDIPEYSTLSQLTYILDKENLLNLLEFFGGLTIKIPTIDELTSIVYTLTLYQYVNIDGMGYNEAIKLIGHKSKDLRQVKSDYNKLCQILDNYNFKEQK